MEFEKTDRGFELKDLTMPQFIQVLAVMAKLYRLHPEEVEKADTTNPMIQFALDVRDILKPKSEAVPVEKMTQQTRRNRRKTAKGEKPTLRIVK